MLGSILHTLSHALADRVRRTIQRATRSQSPLRIGVDIRPFYERLLPVLQSLQGVKAWQVVFVNDGSTDTSGPLLRELRAQDPRVKIITLSRNLRISNDSK